MCRILVSILFVLCVSLPSWARFADCAYVGEVEWNNLFYSRVELECDTTATDTVWTISMEGHLHDGDRVLIKCGNGKVFELHQSDCRFNHVTDSIGHNPITGETMEFYHYRVVVYYNISSEAMKNIADHGITKMRCGKEGYYTDAVYHRNEFGMMLTEAYKAILERLSPDYVPPKKPSIYDGF